MNGYGRGQDNKQKHSSIFTTETWGMVLVLFSFLCFFCLVTKELVFGRLGTEVSNFLLGAFGYFAYALTLSTFYGGILMVLGKRPKTRAKVTIIVILLLVSLIALIHLITSAKLNASSIKDYILACYNAPTSSVTFATGGGALFAVITYPAIKLLTLVGGYIIFSAAAALFIYLLYKTHEKSRAATYKKPKVEGFKNYPFEFDFSENNDESVKESKRLLSYNDEFLLKTKKDIKIEDKKRQESLKILYPTNQKPAFAQFKDSYQESYSQAFDTPTPAAKPVKIVTDTSKLSQAPIAPSGDFFGKSTQYIPPNQKQMPQNINFDASEFKEETYTHIDIDSSFDIEDVLGDDEFDDVFSKKIISPPQSMPSQEKQASAQKSANIFSNFTQDLPKSNVLRAVDKSLESLDNSAKTTQSAPKKTINYSRYNAPSIDVFADYSIALDTTKENFDENRQIIEETLKNFEIPARVVNIIHGPTVTRYDIDIPHNIQSKKVLQYADDIAMRLRSKFGVRIEQNPGDGVLAIEVPNNEKATVGLKGVISSQAFKNAKKESLTIGLGMDVTGSVIVGDVTKMPHLLVAGSTGSGKSVCLNTLIVSLITKYSPEDLRLILIDPKRVEFTIYSGLPHLVINEIICDSPKTITTLNWAIEEMERRYIAFNDKTVRDIDEYNENIDRATEQKMAKIVIIVDELADLMMSNKREIEDRIMKLTQKSRAAGIHLVLATQRPSVDIITGVIKTNLPSRIAFMVSSSIDSRTILDESGAEQLLGNGDMLFRTGNMKMPMRVQGAYISMKEVKAAVTYIKDNNQSYFDEKAAEFINATKKEPTDIQEVESGGEDEIEQVYIDALKTVIQAGQASISMIQRKYPVGYTKAGKIIDWMESKGYISQFEGSKSRQILITEDYFNEMYGDI